LNGPARAFVLLTGCMSLAAPAWAQEPDAPAAEGVEEIVVTARKREENIQDTPISITAFSAPALEARSAFGVEDLDEFTPNLTVNTSSAFSGSSQSASVFIRGIGQTDFTLNTDPGVGIYVDGVYISRAVGSLLDLADVERVEILRGPQGTLFGKNTIGGAINITTRRPSFEPGGEVSALYGSDQWVLLSANATGPLSDRLAAKLFTRLERRDGYVERVNDGVMLGDDNKAAARLGLLFDATEDTRLRFNADYMRSRENGAPLVPREINANALFPTIHNALVAPTLAPTLGSRAFYNAQFVLADPYEVEGTYPVYSNADMWGASLDVEHQTGPLTIRSITAYRDVSSEFSRDGDGSPLQVQSTEDRYDYRQLSQEFQLLGRAANDRLNYIVGAYALDEKGSNPNIVDFGFVRFLSGGRVRNTSYAAFAQGTYRLSDELSLTAGLRYTDEARRFSPDQRVLEQRVTLPIPPFPPEAAVLNFLAGQPLVAPGRVTSRSSEWTPMVTLSFEPSDNLLLYATYSRGFKSGGFAQRLFPANLELGPAGPTGRLLPPPAFGPETASVYETGFKVSTPGRTLQLNGAAYYTDYRDLQVTVQVGVAPTTQNAAAASVRGFELEGQVAPVGDMRLNFGVGYTDAEYDRLDARVTGLTLASKLPGTSKWTLNAGASYDFDLPGRARITPRLDWAYRSSFFFDANNTVGEDGYGIWNFSLTYTAAKSGIDVAAFVKNLSDELYYTHGESILDPAGFTLTAPARGREWGLRVTKSI
jgi:iron complex outermembrane receptor protein